eukprot:7873422-Pyramimonas_sp.AAC.1
MLRRFAAHGLKENISMPAVPSIHNDKNGITQFYIREIKSDMFFRRGGLKVAQDEDFAASSGARGRAEKFEAASYPRECPPQVKMELGRDSAVQIGRRCSVMGSRQ